MCFYIFQQDRGIENVVYWNIEEVLDLFCVEVDSQNVVNINVRKEVCNNFCSDRYMS